MTKTKKTEFLVDFRIEIPYTLGMKADEAKTTALEAETYRIYRNSVLESVHQKIDEAARDGRFSTWINLDLIGYQTSEINKRIMHVAVALRDEGYVVETGTSGTMCSLSIRWD